MHRRPLAEYTAVVCKVSSIVVVSSILLISKAYVLNFGKTYHNITNVFLVHILHYLNYNIIDYPILPCGSW